MPNYKAMYYTLAARVATTIELLIEAQQEGENALLEESHSILVLAQKEESKKEQPGLF